MPKVKEPYLPAPDNTKKYTLVLDLDETLIHYVDMSQNEDEEGKDESFFLTRPFCHKFLQEMAK